MIQPDSEPVHQPGPNYEVHPESPNTPEVVYVSEAPRRNHHAPTPHTTTYIRHHDRHVPNDPYREQSDVGHPQLLSLLRDNTDLRRQLDLATSNVGLQKENISNLDKQLEELKEQLCRAQDDRAALRAALQLPPSGETDSILKAFDRLNRSIEAWSQGACEQILAGLRMDDKTTGDIAQPNTFQDLLRGGEEVGKLFTQNRIFSLEAVLWLSLASHLSECIVEYVFLPFHPALALGDERTDKNIIDGFLRDMRSVVCESQTPVMYSHWRSTTYSAVKKLTKVDTVTLIQGVRSATLDHAARLAKAILGDDLGWNISELPMAKKLEDVVRNAYQWNDCIQEAGLLGEFHPFTVRNGERFSSDYMEFMELPEGTAVADGASAHILFTTSMGLSIRPTRSNNSSQQGSDVESRVRKVKVVTEHYKGF